MEDLTLLGAPILPGRAVDKPLKEKTEKLEKAMSRIHLLQSHDAVTLLLNSISVPKLLYTLQTSECSDNSRSLEFDKLQRKCTTDVINMDDNQWTQATLPVKDGGLGTCSVRVLAPSAFLASAAGTLEIQNDILPVRLHSQVDSSKVSTVNAWKKLTASDVPTDAKQGKQNKIAKKIAKEILDNASGPLDQARLRATLWRLVIGPTNQCSGTMNDERDHQDRH